MKSTHNRSLLALAIGVVVVAALGLAVTRHLAGPALATGIPTTDPLHYSGMLADGAGKPLAGPMNLVITLWDAKTGGSQRCVTTAGKTPLSAGRFRVALDKSCLAAVQIHRDLWVELAVNGALLPRTRIGATPYAVESKNGVPVGTVMAFAGNKTRVPGGWRLCDGKEVSRTGEYAALFKLLDVSHGKGDGATTFNLPDYRGRFLRGVDDAGKLDKDTSTRSEMNSGGNTGKTTFMVGSVQADVFQGHAHKANGHDHGYADKYNPTSSTTDHGTGHSLNDAYKDLARKTDKAYASVGDAVASTFGKPRTSNETRPVNAYVNYIIKY